MTLHAFLVWLGSHACVVWSFGPGPGTHRILFGGSCRDAFGLAGRLGGIVGLAP